MERDVSGTFNPFAGSFVVPSSGTYQIQYIAQGGPTAPVTVSSGPTAQYESQILVNGVQQQATPFPMFDTNIALVLTLRTPLREAQVVNSKVLNLLAGDIVQFAIGNSLTGTAGDFNGRVTITELE
ncbi:MAG TPA: hypothetical protein VG518_08180 [Solirubrobacterales bacterium]|nr:hypothetical protein [Solirubrobacterales bacterium]